MESKEDHPLKATEPTSAEQVSVDGDKTPSTGEKPIPEKQKFNTDFQVNEEIQIKLELGKDTTVNVKEKHKEDNDEEKKNEGKAMGAADEAGEKQENEAEDKNGLGNGHKEENEETITETNGENAAAKDKLVDVGESTTITNKFVDVDLTENNNSTKDSDVKEGERRTRFSSEVEILPKPYFHAGPDTVVRVPLASSNVFVNEMNKSDSSPVILNTTPSTPSEDAPSELPSYLPLTLFSCLFCCPIIGLFAVYKSYSVKKLVDRGEMRNARQASKQARQLAMLTIVIGFLFVFAVIALAILITEVS